MKIKKISKAGVDMKITEHKNYNFKDTDPRFRTPAIEIHCKDPMLLEAIYDKIKGWLNT